MNEARTTIGRSRIMRFVKSDDGGGSERRARAAGASGGTKIRR